MVERVTATEAALDVIEALTEKHGPLMFFQSGGCCDGSSPMCFPLNEFMVGAADEQLGIIGGAPFYMRRTHYEYWKHTQIIVDVVDGQPETFSLEGSEDKCFISRSRLFTDDEWDQLVESGLVAADE